ncbi:MAG: hypothetical protein HY340_00890 [Candidatus Kerfeldbacteria bacterium]|nr:hypothetical protein [Candidatus Kerfeldbacteria bacterium]
MTTTLALALILHVLTGLGGVIASYAAWIGLLKKTPRIDGLQRWGVVALLSYVASWLTGGYYYVVYYGSKVKPVILAGKYSWAHTVLTEAKEHFFLFLPLLAAVLLIVLITHRDRIGTDPKLKRPLVYLAALATAIGTAAAVLGVFISGAYRP